jgi:nucleoid-associated protein YgaU
MGRHSRPTSFKARKLAAVVGAVATVPLTPGVALADAGGPPGGWGGVISCESGGNPRAHNPYSSASGLFQFLSGTWRSLGGLAFGRTAADASVEAQEEIADRAYARSGLTPWEASRACWRRRNVYSEPIETSYPRFQYRNPYRSQYPNQYRHRVVEYTIREGDTLSSIAAEHGHTWRELFQQNRSVVHNPNLINVGVVITL